MPKLGGMTVAAPYFYLNVKSSIELALLVVALVIEAFAFVNCLTQRADAFGAIGTLSKGAWVGLTALAVVLTLLSQVVGFLFGLIAITIAAIYLLDVRPALREAGDGPSAW